MDSLPTENPIVSPDSQIALGLLQKVFQSPTQAFAEWKESESLGSQELRSLQWSFVVLAVLTKFFGNSISYLVAKFLFDEEGVVYKPLQGVLGVAGLYVILSIAIRFLDHFLIYHRERDRVEVWEPITPYFFSLAFLPFLSTSIFWILPNPIPLLVTTIALIYSLNLCFQATKIHLNWTNTQFFILIFKYLIYVMLWLMIPLLGYNIYRTVFL